MDRVVCVSNDGILFQSFNESPEETASTDSFSFLCNLYFFYYLLSRQVQISSSIAVWIHSMKWETFVYTPGYPGRAHPRPHDTIPHRYGSPVSPQTIGPPESPCILEKLVSFDISFLFGITICNHIPGKNLFLLLVNRHRSYGQQPSHELKHIVPGKLSVM